MVMDVKEKETNIHLSGAVLADSLEAHLGGLRRDANLRTSVSDHMDAYQKIITWIRSIYTPAVFPQLPLYAEHANEIFIYLRQSLQIPWSTASETAEREPFGETQMDGGRG